MARDRSLARFPFIRAKKRRTYERTSTDNIVISLSNQFPKWKRKTSTLLVGRVGMEDR